MLRQEFPNVTFGTHVDAAKAARRNQTNNRAAATTGPQSNQFQVSIWQVECVPRGIPMETASFDLLIMDEVKYNKYTHTPSSHTHARTYKEPCLCLGGRLAS